MSVAIKIFLDASIRNGVIGIGVYDYNTKEKISKTLEHKKENSDEAELLALYAAMEYVYGKYGFQTQYQSVCYFTDNMQIYKNGIPTLFLNIFGQGQLFWIPRELNDIADKLSKNGSEVKKTSIIELSEYGNENMVINDRNIIWKLKTYSLEKRLNLLKKIYPNDLQTILVNQYFTEKNSVKKQNYAKSHEHYLRYKNKEELKSLLKFALTIIDKKELTQGSHKAFNFILKEFKVTVPFKPKDILKILENHTSIES